MSYFTNANPDLLNLLNGEGINICEFGCGAGALACETKKRTSVNYYVGADICIDPLIEAKAHIESLIHCDLDDSGIWLDEDFNRKIPDNYFDYIVFGDVLEHLKNPEYTLQSVKKKLNKNGRVLICIPNVQHWSVWVQLAIGHWPRQESGIFDKTHLRWFTLKECVKLFENLGYEILNMKPRIFDVENGFKVADSLAGFADLVGANYDEMVAGMMPYQYVFSLKLR